MPSNAGGQGGNPLILATLLCSAPAFTARVVGTSDGDTGTMLRDNTPVKIRLYGIDAPEAGRDFASRAKRAASDLAFGNTVTGRPIELDRYGRTVAEVTLDGRSLNRELVGQGMAWWYRKYAPWDRELERLEGEAKAAHGRLWSQPRPVPPWEWREGTGGPAGVVGNRRTHVYHVPTRRDVAVMKLENRVEFAYATAAEASGYRKAGDRGAPKLR